MAKLETMHERQDMWLSALEIAWPLHARAKYTDLEACVMDVDAGNDLRKTVEGKSPAQVQFAADAARKAGKVADEAMMADTAGLLAMSFDNLNDFSLLVLAQVLFERDPEEDGVDFKEPLRERNIEAHYRILTSDEEHPFVDYAWIATDFLEYDLATDQMNETQIRERCIG